jgi:hypothetical protein
MCCKIYFEFTPWGNLPNKKNGWLGGLTRGFTRAYNLTLIENILLIAASIQLTTEKDGGLLGCEGPSILSM